MPRKLLFLIAILLVSVAVAQAETVTRTVVTGDVVLDTEDGAKIYGTYYPGAKDDPGVILLHMLRRDRKDWASFAATLQLSNMNVLAIDLRGHGQSTKMADGSPLSLAGFTDGNFIGMELDIMAAVDYLLKQGADPKRIAVVGASIGANVGLAYAANHHSVIKAVALLSPGLKYRGVETETPMGTYEGPVFLSAARNDTYSASSVEKLAKIRPDRCTKNMIPGTSHGTNMISQSRMLYEDLRTWIIKQLK
jgi:dienelactone hydrolase